MQKIGQAPGGAVLFDPSIYPAASLR